MSSVSERAHLDRFPADGAAFLERSKVEPVSIINRSEVERLPLWKGAFDHLRKDSRYYEIVEDTICPEFEYRYFVIKDREGRWLGHPAFFCAGPGYSGRFGSEGAGVCERRETNLAAFLENEDADGGLRRGRRPSRCESGEARRAVAEVLAANIAGWRSGKRPRSS